jgi:putative NADH-flavin reductase
MQITIFGASGKVGVQVVSLALKRGYTVNAFVHSHNPFKATPGLKVITGDIYKLSDVAQAIQGSQAVISCLGSWGSKKGDVLSTAMNSIIPAMVNQKITRIISLTGSGAFDSTDNLSVSDKLSHKLFSVVAGKILADGEKHMRLLRASGLEWTVVRSPVMRSFGGDGYDLCTDLSKLWDSVSRKSVAIAMVDQLEMTDNFRSSPVIYAAHRTK